MHPFLQISPRIDVLPVIHGTAECALAVRRVMLAKSYDCVAVPLPESFAEDIERGIGCLPTPTIVLQREAPTYRGLDSEWDSDAQQPGDWNSGAETWDADDWDSDSESESGAFGADDEPDVCVSYVPIEPCQATIAALRGAMGERIARAYIDLETSPFEAVTSPLPDPYALKKMRPEHFGAALLPFLPRPTHPQELARIHHMAERLRQLEQQFENIVFVCSILHWPWIREAFYQSGQDLPQHDVVEPTQLCEVEPRSLLFMSGELPFITSLYERARAELDDDETLSIDGVKELLLTARAAYLEEFGDRARPITTHTLGLLLKYIRNLTLVERRLTPDLYTLVTASKQVAGDSFALFVARIARDYPLARPLGLPDVGTGIDFLRLPGDDGIAGSVNRLAGLPMEWRSCELRDLPDRDSRRNWQMQWNPLGQCSWPPEDEKIENFRAHVTQRAKAVMGADLVRTEKFTTSVKDGIDMRDTLRNWHTGEIYVKELPPNRGELDAVVMLFDSPADPRRYSWRTTWFAEHQNESTLAFFATNFMEEMVGPGIALATYGGALFLFPPKAIPDIWSDPRIDFADTLEERILAAACLHSRCPHIALLSPLPPSAGWRRLAKRYKKRWVHVPLSQFSAATIQQLRMAHVLNGQEVRSFAAHFIRRA